MDYAPVCWRDRLFFICNLHRANTIPTSLYFRFLITNAQSIFQGTTFVQEVGDLHFNWRGHWSSRVLNRKNHYSIYIHLCLWCINPTICPIEAELSLFFRSFLVYFDNWYVLNKGGLNNRIIIHKHPPCQLQTKKANTACCNDAGVFPFLVIAKVSYLTSVFEKKRALHHVTMHTRKPLQKTFRTH